MNAGTHRGENIWKQQRREKIFLRNFARMWMFLQ